MKTLFVHNNFPGQFKHVASALAKHEGSAVAAIGAQNARGVPGVRMERYVLEPADVSATHPFARRFDLECRRAEQVLYAASHLVSSGFVPDVVVAHSGWGETLPLRSVFPKSRLITYCEFYYRTQGQDVGFDPEFPIFGVDGEVSIRLKNAASLLALAESDAGVSPTVWQRSTYPVEMQSKISTIHDGVDTAYLSPCSDAALTLPNGRTLTRSDEVVTFVNRTLEPLRGFHVFMRALPRIMRQRPSAQIVIIGGDQGQYGYPPPAGQTWRSVFLGEVSRAIDLSRVHFLGRVPYNHYLSALRISSAHVYLTYPFVLSWSLLEAMSVSGLVIASDTAPVREVIDGTNGLLVPFLEPDALAGAVVTVLGAPHKFTAIRERARKTVVQRYDLHRVCLPTMMSFLTNNGP
ncbi:glycosyl transferase family 1 [Methylobacterium sp. V23]|nr:glycosyltransferase [Methylobacterium sp. V23]POR40172.1 glycosyl transferase family 1 [Methylobacterium sp. V23]